MDKNSKKEIVRNLLKKGVLVTPDYLDTVKDNDIDNSDALLSNNDLMIINKELSTGTVNTTNVNWRELERSLVKKDKGDDKQTYEQFLDILDSEDENAIKDVNVVFSYKEREKKSRIQDFVSYFNSRFSLLEPIIAKRPEITKLMAINKLKNKRDRDTVSIIGLVQEIYVTKNNNILLTLEDPTGSIKVLVNNNKPEMFAMAKNLVLDQVIGITGTNSDNIIFANVLVEPDIPLTKSFKKATEEGYAIFLSDIHVGSTYFLEKEFMKFINWINQRSGSEVQRNIASKVRYIFIVGDLVDGVGIYPGQERELTLENVYDQYKECARLLAQIPKHIPLIICAGNHDAVRLSEPQPPLSQEFAAPIWELENATMVSNPSYITIHASENFPGFDVLLYHGYSFDYYVANVDAVRNTGGYDRADLIMKFLLQKRHLAPAHTSTLYIADPEQDYLVIDRIPDFFVTGHIHKCSVSQYRNITLICGSCWQSTTSFQEKLGHHPEPCRVPMVDLKTRKVTVYRFGD
ncbi:MAG: DNA-directed DNA polymerase II small subunit [Candidatus Woesearchaeota archaeon]|jgi:DNA polymerase II small subunit|nr:DNA-directed DNA polymerase II small subunit [Candidatus Woesearchaeota archaeon]